MIKEYIAYAKGMTEKFMSDQVAIVTGSSKGIGRDIAVLLAETGAKVIVCCNSNRKGGEAVCAAIRARGGDCELFQGDLTKYTEAEQLIDKTFKAFGRIDVLVNNAGITDPRHFSIITEEDWDRVESSNMKSAFNCSHHAMPYLVKNKKGRVLNISSVCAKSGGLGAGAHYCASKSGMIGFTKALANQYADQGITVNAIAPAMIDTEMIAWRTKDQMDAVIESIPLHRLGEIKEVAFAALFLCSPFASFVTGYTMDVNGGIYMD